MPINKLSKSWSVDAKVFDEFVQLVVKGRVPPVIVRLIFPSFTDAQYGFVMLEVSTIKESGWLTIIVLSTKQLFWSDTFTDYVPSVKLLAVSVVWIPA